MSLKILDAKITHVNGGLTISWLFEDGNWSEPMNHSAPDDACTNPDVAKEWCQTYKDNFNVGKEQEDAKADMEEIPDTMQEIIDQPLNLS